MVLCIIALAVFSVMGIFSAKYRQLAQDAFSCVKEMLIFKPCTTKLDDRIKMKITGKLMGVPGAARFFYKNFTAISWAFTLTFIASTVYSAYALFNLFVYGSCNGKGTTCALTPFASAIDNFFNQVSCNQNNIAYAILAILAISLVVIVLMGMKKKPAPAEVAQPAEAAK